MPKDRNLLAAPFGNERTAHIGCIDTVLSRINILEESIRQMQYLIDQNDINELIIFISAIGAAHLRP